MDAHFWAMVLALLACGVGAAVHQKYMDHDQDPHSPDPGWLVVSWLKRLVRRETSHETDPAVSSDEDPDVERYEWGFIDRTEGTTRVDLRPPATDELTQLEGWVRRELLAKRRPKDIVVGGKQRFGASRATVYRAMSKVRGR